MDAKLPTPPFRCSICNKVHNELPDVGYREPGYTHELTDLEKRKRVRLTSDLCILDDEHFFIRGLMEIPIEGTSQTLGFGVWSTLSKVNFERYEAHFEEDMSDGAPMFGYLSNRLPGFPDKLSLQLSVQTQRKGMQPLFALHDCDHPLAVAQREGITVEKWWEIVAPVLHGPK